MSERINNITINGARILFRNFAGKEGQYNPAGKRSFCVLLDPDLAGQLAEDGWNVKQLRPREEGEAPQDYIQVGVNYESPIQPKIWLVAGDSKTLLDGESVASLDYAEIQNVDLVIRPYQWEIKRKNEVLTGVKAYVKTMYVMIVEDELEKRYSRYEDTAAPHEAIPVPDDLPF